MDGNPTYNAYEKDIAMVNFYFDKSSILQYIRQERMTKVDYISQMGGLLGPERIADRGPHDMFLISHYLYKMNRGAEILGLFLIWKVGLSGII